MSLAQIEAEVRRFLSTEVPEVICIKGRWGVGKTFAWKRILKAAIENGDIKLNRYSYVSLFGLNSLDDLRFSIFENTTTGPKIGFAPDESSFRQLVDKSSDLARRSRPVIDAVSAFFNKKGTADVLFRTAFLMVRNQIICLDDLERAGTALSSRDVLGLASFLKEERGCKVVLLLNDKEHDDKAEFERQLEKVADVTLVFDLNPAEAAEIALGGSGAATKLVKPLIITLGVTNIRVIKKIERLAERLLVLLNGLDENVIESAASTLVLASWSVQQPTEAPPLEFLKRYNRFSVVNTAGDDSDLKFRRQIEDYPFNQINDLDVPLIEGAVSGFFNESAVRLKAEELQRECRKNTRASEFERTWEELYHGSLSIDDDVFLDSLYRSSISESAGISPLNINGTIRMLREFGRDGKADELISHYIDVNSIHGPEFFDIEKHHFSRDDQIDDGLRAAFMAKWREFIDTRDPLAVLKDIAEHRSWSNGDVALMARQSEEDFERMFEALEGKSLRRGIEMLGHIGRGHDANASAIRTAYTAALKRIAAKSPIRARKISGLGVQLE